MRKLLPILLLLLLSLAAPAKGRATHTHHIKHTHHTKRTTHANRSTHKARSTTARARFQRANPCPATGKRTGACPGYVVDHKVPIKRGGPDSPANMQWQTREAAKAKDRIE